MSRSNIFYQTFYQLSISEVEEPVVDHFPFQKTSQTMNYRVPYQPFKTPSSNYELHQKNTLGIGFLSHQKGANWLWINTYKNTINIVGDSHP